MIKASRTLVRMLSVIKSFGTDGRLI